MMRLLWLSGGILALALGFIGVFLPLLPTVPFILLAAFCFSRSSERLHSWLLSHRIFGPQIENWQRNGAIGRRAKQYATLSIAIAFCISLALGLPGTVLAIQALCLGGALLFIWTRPEG